MIASPLSVGLMNFFSTSSSTGVAPTFMVMGLLYLIFMMFGSLIVRVPPKDWMPGGFVPKSRPNRLITTAQVSADDAIRTPQFYLLFAVLMLNVTAGIGVLGQASVMIQEMFSVAVVGPDIAVDAVAAGGFVGLLSIFNMIGRFFWSSLSDMIGRKNTYHVFFLLGAVLYATIPTIGHWGNVVLFVGAFGVIISMYGGGFATIPAYLKDMFGAMQVGAIHGRLLLAWSSAAILGPVLINYIRAYQIDVLGLQAARAYSLTMYLMAALLVIGFLCNALIKPVQEKYHFKELNK
jgi:MFS family permease